MREIRESVILPPIRKSESIILPTIINAMEDVSKTSTEEKKSNNDEESKLEDQPQK